jgi:hypothetical protein
LKSTSVSLPRIEAAPICGGEVHELKLDLRKPRQWIDLAHDVVLTDAELAVREGYVSVEHFKRYTTTGMSVDQGKTGNLNAFTVLGQLTGRATGMGNHHVSPPLHASHAGRDRRFVQWGFLFTAAPAARACVARAPERPLPGFR